MKQKPITTRKEDLVQSRKEQLRSLQSQDEMKGHGKYRNMDVFSWPNPNFDKLSTMISSFPFPVIWIGCHEQIRCTTTYYPETRAKVEAAIIHDTSELKFNSELIDDLKQIIAAGSLEHAMSILDNWRTEEKHVLLFSTEGEKTGFDLDLFEDFLR